MSAEISLRIVGMSCDHCLRAVKEALASVAGVDEAQVDLDSGIAKVRGDADRDSLIGAVVEAGYSVGD